MSRSGQSVPWREWDGEAGPDGTLVFVRDGQLQGELGQLAEALRADGVASNLGDAWHMANDAAFERGYYGYVEELPVPIACSDQGETEDGDRVATAWPCVFAVIT
jgi:hypothetical protein